MFRTVSNSGTGGHTFRTMEAMDLEQLIQDARQKYAEVRCDTRIPLRDISLAGIDVLNVDTLRQLLNIATIPPRTHGNFDVVRADFGEVLSILILENEFGTSLCWIGVRDRERSDMPGRGMDIIGVESGTSLRLILCEVKVSDEGGRIPQVVDRSDDSLSKQFKKHMTDHARTSSRLWEAVRRTADESTLILMIKAACCWDTKAWQQLDVICCASLVRPQNKYHERDFGRLRRSPDSLKPGLIRFVILRLDGEIESLVDAFGQVN